MHFLKDKFRHTRIILASGSPRRQSLLRETGIEFELAGNDNVDENYPSDLKKEEIPVYLAVKKSWPLEYLLNNKVILITADTIVWHNCKVMDKPRDREDAISILTALSGQMHEVISGVCLRSSAKTVTFYSSTNVKFHELTPGEIRYYVDSYKPYDKAGAYGIQEWIGYIGIESVSGSFYNVMGLPVDKLYRNLMEF